MVRSVITNPDGYTTGRSGTFSMRLLVSVATPDEAAAALAGGADVIDAKDPTFALGAVPLQVLQQIHVTCAGMRPVTAALGDANDEAAVDRAARLMTAAGASLVKIGFAGITDCARVSVLLTSAVRATRAQGGGIVAVAYADADRAASLAPEAFPEIAARAGATGVLLDTADKQGLGLRALMSPLALAAWVTRARDARLVVALAGKLQADDLAFVRDAGADIAGVRGAACDGARTGRVSAEKVRQLARLIGPAEAGHYVPGADDFFTGFSSRTLDRAPARAARSDPQG